MHFANEILRPAGLIAFAVALLAWIPPASAGDNDMNASDIWGLDEIRQLPLDLEVLSSSVEEGIKVDEVTFTSEIVDGKPVRVYGFLARPVKEQGRLPGVLALHGGGGTASRSHAVASAESLDACILNIDWSGDEKRAERVTDAAALPDKLFGDPRHVNDEITDFSARHTVRALVRCIDFLSTRDEVDPERIAVVGGSWGGFLSLLVSGLDPRVKCAASGFGAGGFRGTYELCARTLFLLNEEQREFWYSKVDPINYLERINGPVSLLTATNELHFWLNTAMATFERLPPGSRIVISPNTVHTAGSGVLWPHNEWVKHCLQGAPDWPAVEGFVCDGGTATWTVRCPVPVTRSTLYFSPGRDHWPGRIWLPVQTKKSGDVYTAVLPEWLKGVEGDMYPLVTDEMRRSVSALPVHVEGASTIVASGRRPDPGLIDDFSGGVALWRLLFGNNAKALLQWRAAVHGEEPAMLVTERRGQDTEIEVETNVISLAVACMTEDAVLSMLVDVQGHEIELAVELFEDPGEREENVFAAECKLAAVVGWQRVRIPLGDFRGPDNEPAWDSIRKLNLKWDMPANSTFAFAEVRMELSEPR